jgi:hypothetical protein
MMIELDSLGKSGSTNYMRRFHMSGKKSNEAWDRTLKAADQLKPVADQMKPLAKNAGQAAKRNLHKTRAWAAPQLERTGQVLQDTVAPKVASALSTAADRIDPAKPRGGRWKLPVGIAAILAAAASAVAAVATGRKRAQSTTAAPTGSADTSATSTNGATAASQNGTPSVADSDGKIRAS